MIRSESFKSLFLSKNVYYNLVIMGINIFNE